MFEARLLRYFACISCWAAVVNVFLTGDSNYREC